MTEAVIAVPLCELLFIVSALPRSLIVFALPCSAALQRATGAQLLALRIGEAGVGLAHVGALLVVQDAPLLGFVTGRQCQQHPGTPGARRVGKEGVRTWR